MIFSSFHLHAPYEPSGDQPSAIAHCVDALAHGKRDTAVLGVTGSGKTFTMANVIARLGRPALIMAHNKILAAQLFEEFKAFFPENAVEYFVSYYDYYQPEAYVPRSDTYIEKTASINEQIDRLRHSATRALFERRDVIIVASVSCIYGIGDPETYASMSLPLVKGDVVDRDLLLKRLIELQYSRNDTAFTRGTFRVRGDTVDIYPSHLEDAAWRLSFFDDDLESVVLFDTLTGEKLETLQQVIVYPNSHHVVPRPTVLRAMKTIEAELNETLPKLEMAGKLLEAQRLKDRVRYDLEMMHATGYCNGIENYSRHLTGRPAGSPPPTLFDYLPQDCLLFVDESHVTVPQVGGMSRGDAQRKQTLVDYGFRLPSARDNRPLTFDEWNGRRPQTVYVSATPAQWELDRAADTETGGGVTEMVVRPTGLVDPPVFIHPVEGQIDDLMEEIRHVTAQGYRTLVTTLTKKMAEQLTDYLAEHGVKVRYMHSDIDAIERSEIVRDLRLGAFDVLVGINLLREGLDIPEVALVAILDADKEGFLRSTTSLIQTMGRAARNVDGRVILYADVVTDSMKNAMAEADRRRAKQEAYNKAHGITPASVAKEVRESLQGAEGSEVEQLVAAAEAAVAGAGSGARPARGKGAGRPSKAAKGAAGRLTAEDLDKQIASTKKAMMAAAAELEFEKAAALRDQLHALEKMALALWGEG